MTNNVKKDENSIWEQRRIFNKECEIENRQKNRAKKRDTEKPLILKYL